MAAAVRRQALDTGSLNGSVPCLHQIIGVAIDEQRTTGYDRQVGERSHQRHRQMSLALRPHLGFANDHGSRLQVQILVAVDSKGFARSATGQEHEQREGSKVWRCFSHERLDPWQVRWLLDFAINLKSLHAN